MCVLFYIHPASRGVAAHTAGLFRSVRGAKGGVEYEEQSSTGELTYCSWRMAVSVGLGVQWVDVK